MISETVVVAPGALSCRTRCHSFVFQQDARPLRWPPKLDRHAGATWNALSNDSRPTNAKRRPRRRGGVGTLLSAERHGKRVFTGGQHPGREIRENLDQSLRVGCGSTHEPKP